MRHPLVMGLLGLGVGVFAVAATGYGLALRLNLTDSIPPGLYRVVDQPFGRGSTVLACLPKPVADFARSRGYVPRGSCEDGSAPVGKRVAAVAGDTIEVLDRGVLVNGQLLPNSAPLARDSQGRALPRLPTAIHVVRSGEVWLVSSHSTRSYDSRYFGGIPESRITARVEPVLIAP